MIEDPDLDRRANGGPIRFEASVGGRSRAPRVAVALAVVAVAVLVAKPWDLVPAAAAAPPVAQHVAAPSGAAPGQGHGSGPAAATTAEATATEKAVNPPFYSLPRSRLRQQYHAPTLAYGRQAAAIRWLTCLSGRSSRL